MPEYKIGSGRLYMSAGTLADDEKLREQLQRDERAEFIELHRERRRLML